VTSREIIQAALALPPDDRARIVEELRVSLGADPAFIAMIRKREDDFRNGVPGIPADEVFDELLAE